MSKERKIKFIATARRWFDRANGNTYHSVMITRARASKTIYCPMTYGYDDCYRQTALEAMAKAKFLPVAYRDNNGSWAYERENNYPIEWNVTDGTKKDCIANGIDQNA